MRSIMSGLLALAWLVVAIPMSAHAGATTYTPAKFKAAIAKGETVLLHYKSTW